NGSACACAQYCANVKAARDEGGDKTIRNGPTHSSTSMGCSALGQHMPKLPSPLRGNPSTGEPCAGDPPARFGGRGDANHVLPTPIGPSCNGLIGHTTRGTGHEHGHRDGVGACAVAPGAVLGGFRACVSAASV